ncbi:hypothetical protein SDC9_72239 [bioreactor metagenome]|uniref:Fluoroquinolones export permease protein n=1 Tax=bioreactor metagenome TaxID=1076179 RepID=A0A644YBS1_9ZZZZ
MRPLFRSFALFVRQILRDSMLAAVCGATLLTAFFFRYGIPAVERALYAHFQRPILEKYYLLFDLLLALLIPYLLTFAASMMMLTEYDENIAGYLAVTPVGKRGYVESRLGLSAAIAFAASVVLVRAFSLTQWKLSMIILVSMLTGLASVGVALLLFSLSHNRVEGMAMAKMSGLLLMGLPVPFFLLSNTQYLFSPLPTFWIAKLGMEPNLIYFFAALLTSVLWILLLYGKFRKKLM